MSETATGVVKRNSDHYCTNCYQVIPIGGVKDHRKEEHDNSFTVDIVPIHSESEGLIAQQRDMGHYDPHHWINVDGHDMCANCGAVKVVDQDIPDSLIAEREAEEQ